MKHEDAFLAPDYARFYDWAYEGHDADLAFWCDLARQYGSPILEVACGTGRVAIPLARQGFAVTGMDFSPHVLAIARARVRAMAKADAESEDVARRIRFVEGDMRSFDLGQAFAAVFIPNASVFHLADRQSLGQCFSCLHRHTKLRGIAVVDVVSPGRMANQQVGVERQVAERINPATGLLTRELNRKELIDRDRQVVRCEHTYVECTRDGPSERRYAFTQDYRWIEKDEGVDLFEAAGFVDVYTAGAYDGSAYSAESPRLILIGTRRE